MKRLLSLIICTIVFVGCFPLNAFASNYEITPYYNNAQRTSTTFDINENGVATVKTFISGYSHTTTGATIRIKLQKNFYSSSGTMLLLGPMK